jgi:hypothetical protein
LIEAVKLGTSPPLRVSTDLCGVAPTRNASESQARSADDAERQSETPVK